MILYRNEALVIKDSMLYEFKKKYKNLGINIMILDNNEIVNNFVITVVDTISKHAYGDEIRVKELENYGQILFDFTTKVDSVLYKVMRGNYYNE